MFFLPFCCSRNSFICPEFFSYLFIYSHAISCWHLVCLDLLCIWFIYLVNHSKSFHVKQHFWNTHNLLFDFNNALLCYWYCRIIFLAELFSKPLYLFSLSWSIFWNPNHFLGCSAKRQTQLQLFLCHSVLIHFGCIYYTYSSVYATHTCGLVQPSIFMASNNFYSQILRLMRKRICAKIRLEDHICPIFDILFLCSIFHQHSEIMYIILIFALVFIIMVSTVQNLFFSLVNFVWGFCWVLICNLIQSTITLGQPDRMHYDTFLFSFHACICFDLNAFKCPQYRFSSCFSISTNDFFLIHHSKTTKWRFFFNEFHSLEILSQLFTGWSNVFY